MTPDEYSKIPDRLRGIASKMVGDSRKEILKIATELEQVPETLFAQTHARRYWRLRAKSARQKQPPVLEPGQGAEAVNRDRSNEERREEAIADLEKIVSDLKKSHDWDALRARERIALIQTESLKLRGAKFSTQTLYKDGIRGLW